MAATSSIIILCVMATCPSKLNRHGGLAVATIEGSLLHPILGKVPTVEPCPVDVNHNLVLNSLAYVDAASGVAMYRNVSANAALGLVGMPVTDLYLGNHSSVCYNDAQCSKMPFNPTQPQASAAGPSPLAQLAASRALRPRQIMTSRAAVLRSGVRNLHWRHVSVYLHQLHVHQSHGSCIAPPHQCRRARANRPARA